MLKKYVFTLKSLQGGQPINSHIGSIMQGVLMEYLPENIVVALHEQSLRPYSQYVKGYGQEGEWHLHALTSEMVENFDQLWIQWDNAEIVSRQKGNSYLIEHKYIGDTVSYSDLCKKYFLTTNVGKYVDIIIKTPLSFKSNGIYLNWPDLHLLIRNLCKRWNAFSDDMKFDDQEIIEFLEKSMALGFYKLSSTRFDMEGTYIPAAQGQFSVRLTGNDMAKRWIGLLLEFATYAGVGVKTAMGMGGIESKMHSGHSR